MNICWLTIEYGLDHALQRGVRLIKFNRFKGHEVRCGNVDTSLRVCLDALHNGEIRLAQFLPNLDKSAG